MFIAILALNLNNSVRSDMFNFTTKAATSQQHLHATPLEFENTQKPRVYKHFTPSGVVRGASLRSAN